MDLTNPILTVIPSLEGRVLAILGRTSQPLTGRRIAQLAPDVSHRGVQFALDRLVRTGLVIADPSTHAVLYTANERHLLWDAVAALVHVVDEIPQRLRKLIRDVVVMTLGEEEAAETAVALFGSVARGTSTPDSDVDLLVVTAYDQSDDYVEGLKFDLIHDISIATGNACNVYITTRDGIDDLVKRHDPMVESWLNDAETIIGPDIHKRLKGAPWPA